MKKLVSLLLAVCMCLSIGIVLTACDEEHTHTYKTEWAKNTTHHWHECEGTDCTDVSDKAEHSFTDGICVCGYEQVAAHTCVFKTEWSNDTTHHWHACETESCSEVSGKAEHSFIDGVCVCGYEQPATHTCVFDTEYSKDATHHWYACSLDGCTKVSGKTGHSWDGGACTACGFTYMVTESEWNALFGGDTFKNTTANTTAKTYANDVLSESATTTGVVQIAENSLYIRDENTNSYITNMDNSWYYIMKEGNSWYGIATNEAYYNVSETPVFDYIFESEGFSSNLEYTNFSYNNEDKCYFRDLGTVSGVYRMGIKVYFENGMLMKMEYITEWSNDGYQFKTVQTATFSNYGTTVLTIPSWTVWTE